MATTASSSASHTSSSNGSTPSQRTAVGIMSNRIRIFGSTWSECGYCKGRRSSMAVRDNEGAANGGEPSIASPPSRSQPGEGQGNHSESGAAIEEPNDPSACPSMPDVASSRAYTVLATNLDPDVYGSLIERGWRRSGRALYKPDNSRSCCPALTIRLAASAFQPTKAQRKLAHQARRRLSPSLESAGAPAPGHNDDDGDDASSHPMSVDAMIVPTTVTSQHRGSLDPRPPKKKGRPSQIADPGDAPATSMPRPAVLSSDPPQIATALHPSIVPSGLDPALASKLQEWTRTALQAVLAATEGNGGGDDNRVVTSILASVPVQYKVVTSPPKKRSGGAATSHAIGRRDVTTLSTAVCAALCGRLTAAAGATTPPLPSRDELLQRLAKELERQFGVSDTTLSGSLSSPGGTTASAAEAACRIVRVEAHAPSGQVLVHVAMEGSSRSSNGAAAAASGRRHNGATFQNGVAVLTPSQNGDVQHQHETNAPNDKVAQWWRRSVALHVQPQQQQASSPAPGALASAAFVRWAAMTAAGVSPPEPPYEMRVTTLPAHESALDPEVHRLYVEYQHAVHGDPDPFASFPIDAVVATTVTNSLSRAGSHNGFLHGPTEDKDMLDLSEGNGEDQEEEEDEEDDGDEGSLYRWTHHAPSGYRDRVDSMLQSAYPRAMSHPHLRRQIVSSFGGFYEFLVENPFDFSPNETLVGSSVSGSVDATANSKARLPPGTYHQHYRLGRVLVAVGVVDVLPSGLSSVYLFYDPAFAREVIPMGKYAILKEIEFTRDALRLPYYYLGYYIESCPKMRYKIEYKPSELLCPVTYRWVDAEQGKATLLRDSPLRHCCRLSLEEEGGETERSQQEPDGSRGSQAPHAAHEVMALDVGAGFAVTLNHLQPRGRAFLEPILRAFVEEAGDRVAPRCTIAFR